MKISMILGNSTPDGVSEQENRELKSIIPGDSVVLGNNTKIKLESLTQHRALDVPTVLNFIVETSTAMEVGLITSWLYDTCKEKKAELEIEEKKVEIDKKEIERSLGEALRAMDKNITIKSK